MEYRSGFLNLPTSSHNTDLPMADFERVQNPSAVAAARAKIAQIMEPEPISIEGAVSLHPQMIITDKMRLAKSAPVKQVPKRAIPTPLKPILATVGVFAIVLLLFKAPVVWSQVQYMTTKPSATPATLPVAGNAAPAEPTITIPKINVYAPVVYEPSVVEANVQKALEGGVVHYGNTAFPGQNGNSVIFGHSSNDWWEPGNFKFVFVLLDKLAPGDRFTVDYQSKRYTYEVTESKIVAPTDLSVLNQTPVPTLTLITCSPPGTSLKRLVVVAKQIDPAPVASTSKTNTPAPNSNEKSLPSSQSGFFEQVGQTMGGIGEGISSLFGGGNKDASSEPTQSPNGGGTLPAIK